MIFHSAYFSKSPKSHNIWPSVLIFSQKRRTNYYCHEYNAKDSQPVVETDRRLELLQQSRPCARSDAPQEALRWNQQTRSFCQGHREQFIQHASSLLQGRHPIFSYEGIELKKKRIVFAAFIECENETCYYASLSAILLRICFQMISC